MSNAFLNLPCIFNRFFIKISKKKINIANTQIKINIGIKTIHIIPFTINRNKPAKITMFITNNGMLKIKNDNLFVIFIHILYSIIA